MRFFTLFWQQLRRSRWQILGWGGALFALAAYLVALHDAFISQQEQFQNMINAYPPELMAAFGDSDLFTPGGLNFTYFSYAVVLLGFLGLSVGSGLLAADEERGRLELPVAYPVSRMHVFMARLAAVLVGMVTILILPGWDSFC